jgi:hypothetical protein
MLDGKAGDVMGLCTFQGLRMLKRDRTHEGRATDKRAWVLEHLDMFRSIHRGRALCPGHD